MPDPVLNGQTVYEIYKKCALQPEESTREKLDTLGITSLGHFNFYRIEQHRHEIHELVSQLSAEFKTPGGASYLRIHLDHHGDTWVGNYATNDPKEQLLKLGLAIQEVEIVDQHITWPGLPGGVPRIRVKQ